MVKKTTTAILIALMLAVPALAAVHLPTAEQAHEKSKQNAVAIRSSAYIRALDIVKMNINEAIADGYFRTSPAVAEPGHRKPIAAYLRTQGYVVVVSGANLIVSW